MTSSRERREPDKAMRMIGKALAYAIAAAFAVVVVSTLAAGAWWVVRAVWSL